MHPSESGELCLPPPPTPVRSGGEGDGKGERMLLFFKVDFRHLFVLDLLSPAYALCSRHR